MTTQRPYNAIENTRPIQLLLFGKISVIKKINDGAPSKHDSHAKIFGRKNYSAVPLRNR